MGRSGGREVAALLAARGPRGGARALEQAKRGRAGAVAEAGPGARHNAPYACEPDRRGLARRKAALC